jgi:hypothetical protein
LINRKHRSRPPESLLITRWKLVGAGRLEIAASIFMPQASFSIVAKNVWAWRIFWTNEGNNDGSRGRSPTMTSSDHTISADGSSRPDAAFGRSKQQLGHGKP